ncbi:MAG: hypothetical protein WAO56_08780 [Miniphocaeibacter sp.]|uniref:hypothetical protein n=1 Tax=Miniphocaeibacter sp. TaxID=3100973 RepID=UPI00184780ED|nr:hypothetical protein [Gallicola sp.]
MKSKYIIDYTDKKPLFIPIIGEIYLIEKIIDNLSRKSSNNIILTIYIVFLIVAVILHLRYIVKYFANRSNK